MLQRTGVLALAEGENILRTTLLKAIQYPSTGRSTQQGKNDGTNLGRTKGNKMKLEEYENYKKKAPTVAMYLTKASVHEGD